ncbi:MAG: tRNA (adenosine(37)-N6)-dimethylallyltransferase MiaA [Candidatus Yanofskybacteria bacterium]|nr:tRNA (adenosine(37)-N6)-dimethylallyltransferase MiaA [Candidatus Yanofskybacteria bacterium]
MSKNKKNKVLRQIQDRPKIVVIVGPTASGKTILSMEIARLFNGEIISADSRQIYRGMDIGTAKAVPKSKIPEGVATRPYGAGKTQKSKLYFVNGVRYYLVNIKNTNQDYSVGQYKKDALVAIRKILKAGKLPVIVGGTGLYVSAITNNLEFPEVKENKKLRAELEEEIKKYGLVKLYEKLIQFDPEAAYIVDPKNPRRVIRAMEVALLTGKPFSAQRKSGLPLFNFLHIGLKLPPEILKEKIQKRTAQMIKNNLVEEVKKLVKKYGYKPKALDAIGYREIIDYLRGNITLKEAEGLINKNTWHYARRQMAWFRKDHTIGWFDITQKLTRKKIIKTVSNFLRI